MDKEKRRLGYPTPAAELEDKFLEISQLLDANKISWRELGQKARALFDERQQELESLIGSVAESDKLRIELVALTFQSSHFAIIIDAIAELGQDVSRTHKQLAKIEKAVKELKLALKA